MVWPHYKKERVVRIKKKKKKRPFVTQAAITKATLCCGCLDYTVR